MGGIHSARVLMATNRGYGPKIKAAVYGIYGGTLSDPPPCFRCGMPAESVDHIIAHALGGTDDLENLRPACLSCNSKDGARLGAALKKRKLPHSDTTGRPKQLAIS